MKTPMQELIDKLYQLSEMHASDMYKAGMRDSAIIAETMLEKEKDVIENAYWDGGQQVPAVGSRCEEYHNKTFNTETDV